MIARAIVFFAFYLLASPLYAQSSYSLPHDSNKILFLGNSISYAGQYLTYVETYLRLRYPERNWEFINLGLPSETVSGLSEEGHAGGSFPRPVLQERLDRVLKAIEPDFIFSCYGMNDGIYLPFDDSRFDAYKKGQEKLQKKADSLGIPLIHLTPPVYDPVKDPAYASVLAVYASWMVSQRYIQNWNVIDLHWPMRKFLEIKRENNPDFALATDGIHPGEQGHWIMARELLKGIGESRHLEADLPNDAFDSMPLGSELLPLVREKQELMRDAWLRYSGHERPGLREGLPMDQALSKKDELMKSIASLLSSGRVN